ncbi:unnamed protein product [Rhizopus microsporus]
MLEKSEMPRIDLKVSDEIWIRLYMDISKYEFDNYNMLSEADRQRVTARLYREENGKFGRHLLSESCTIKDNRTTGVTAGATY